MNRQHRPSRRAVRSGFTFIDMAVSVVVVSILISGVGASVFIATKSMPSPTSASQSSMAAFRIVDQLATELESAIYITQHTATSLGFTVPDRTGDGIPERIFYNWSGASGTSLTRQYNGGTAVAIASSVTSFVVVPNCVVNSQSYPALGVEDAAESLQTDYGNTSSNLNNVTVQSTAALGQYFSPTLPSGATAWRPTRVQFLAKKNPGIIGVGSTQLQVVPANATLIPTTTVLATTTLTNGSLPSSYAYQQFSFSGLSPLAPGGGICLTLQTTGGLQSAIVEDNGAYSGELKTNLLGAWSSNSSRALMCQLYGKLTRSSGYQYVNSKYLTSVGISLQLSSASPVQTTTCASLNHPELLNQLWELTFDKNPTTVDVNGDASGDWIVDSGGSFNTSSLSNGVWQTTTVQLDTNPTNNFATTTVVDLRFQNTSTSGNGAIFYVNALRSGTTCAPLQASLDLQSDGTQTLVVSGKSNDATVVPLITIPGLPNQMIDLNLIIDPTTRAVSVTINGAQYGTYPLTRYASSDSSAYASIYAGSSAASFSYVRIRVLEN